MGANPIQDILPKLVGECLKPAECQQCAKNIVGHYSNLYAEQLQRERREKELERKQIAKQKQEEDQIRQRRKEEKKRRQEERKLEEKKLKNAEKVNGHIDDGKTEAADANQTMTKKQSSGLCLKFFYFMLLLLLV